MSKIELKHVDKYYGKNHILKDVNLTIEDGDFMTLLGPSGCGKTTTLRVVSGLEKPQNGTILMNGKEIVNAAEAHFAPPSERDLNLVFQSYALWPHMTVRENIAFGLNIQKLPKDEVNRRIEDALARMQIGQYVDRYPSELSGGQQQRVAIARAIASEPHLLLMDEPLSNLDAALRVQMRQEIRRIQQEAGITALFVTHDQEEALSLSDRIVLLDAGRLQQEGTPKELYMAPRNLFTARFFSNPPANVLETSSAELGLLWKPRALPARAATAVIRPHMLELCPDAPLSGTVVSAEILGRECLVRVRCLSSTLTALTSSASVPAVGTTQGVVLKNEPYFFDSSGARAGEDRR